MHNKGANIVFTDLRVRRELERTKMRHLNLVQYDYSSTKRQKKREGTQNKNKSVNWILKRKRVY